MNRVYLSSWFASKDRIKAYSEELAEAGIEVTSSWVGENVSPSVTTADVPDHYLRHTAIIDIHDMMNANRFVVFVPSDEELEAVSKRSWSRGGRNFETGFFYALIMLRRYLAPSIPAKDELMIVGPRESVFHWLFDMAHGADEVRGITLPEIKQFDTWSECKSYLKGECKYEHGGCSQVSRVDEETAPSER